MSSPRSDPQRQAFGQGQRPQEGSPNSPQQDDCSDEVEDMDIDALEEESIGDNTEKGSGSGIPEKNEGTAGCKSNWPTVAPEPGKERNSKGADYSKKNREKNKELEKNMEAELTKIQKQNKTLKRSLCEANETVDACHKKIRSYQAEVCMLKKTLDTEQNLIEVFLKSQEKICSLEKENIKLKAENAGLRQQLNADQKGVKPGKK